MTSCMLYIRSMSSGLCIRDILQRRLFSAQKFRVRTLNALALPGLDSSERLIRDLPSGSSAPAKQRLTTSVS